MIAKRIVRKAGASNFARLGSYILEEKANALEITQRIADYILDSGGEGHRVGGVRFFNCDAETPADAIKEIIATQAMNARAKGDRTYHLVVSFAAGERPTPDQLTDIENTLCAEIGLDRHQRLSAVHTDTDHLHIHIAINKVHPTSFRINEPYYDQRRLMAACEALECKHGLQRTNHGQAAAKPSHKRNCMSEKHGEQRFRDQVRQTFDHHLETQLVDVDSWQALHRLFNGHRLALRLRGAGLVIADSQGDLTVKASAIDSCLSFKALTDRFGPFAADTAISSKSGLDQDFDATFIAIKASYAKRGKAIRASRTLTAVGKRAAYRDLAKLRRAAYDRLKSEGDRDKIPIKHNANAGGDQTLKAKGVDASSANTAVDPRTSTAAIRSYVSSRNSLRPKISDINHHRPWMPNDAGPVHFHGRRRLGDGSWAFLLLKDETMLVKAISQTDAERASLWPIGKVISLDTEGRVVKLGRVR